MSAEEKYAYQPSHHVDSRVEPGTVFHTYRNKQTGTVIESMRREDRLFVAICTNHGMASKPSDTREATHRSSRFPQGWCEGCQKLLGITEPKNLPDPRNAEWCAECKAYRANVVHYGHLLAVSTVPLCPACRKKPKVRERVQIQFSGLIAASRKEWKGKSKLQRKQAMKRIAMGSKGDKDDT